MKVKVIIEETISKEFEVEAESVEDAMAIVKHKYHDTQEFVLDNATLVEGPRVAFYNPETKEATSYVDL